MLLLVRRLGALFLPFLLAALTLLAALAGLAACDAPGTSSRQPRPAGDPASTAAAADSPERSAPRFAPGQLERHFAKHGAEMGIATQDQYLRDAQALVRGGPGVETFRRGGDTLFFREATGDFAVLSDRNVIRTYFRPTDGRRYWERQKQR